MKCLFVAPKKSPGIHTNVGQSGEPAANIQIEQQKWLKIQ